MIGLLRMIAFQFLDMTLAVDITDGRGLSNEACRKFLSMVMLYLLHNKCRLTSCTLLTRWSASVLKVGMPCVGCGSYKRRLAYSTCYS